MPADEGGSEVPLSIDGGHKVPDGARGDRRHRHLPRRERLRASQLDFAGAILHLQLAWTASQVRHHRAHPQRADSTLRGDRRASQSNQRQLAQQHEHHRKWTLVEAAKSELEDGGQEGRLEPAGEALRRGHHQGEEGERVRLVPSRVAREGRHVRIDAAVEGRKSLQARRALLVHPLPQDDAGQRELSRAVAGSRLRRLRTGDCRGRHRSADPGALPAPGAEQLPEAPRRARQAVDVPVDDVGGHQVRLSRRLFVLRQQPQRPEVLQTIAAGSAGRNQHRALSHHPRQQGVRLRAEFGARWTAGVPHAAVQPANHLAARVLRVHQQGHLQDVAAHARLEVAAAAEARRLSQLTQVGRVAE